jgi:hypothetical protein
MAMNKSKWQMVGLAVLMGAAAGLTAGMTVKRGGKWAKPLPLGASLAVLGGVMTYLASNSAYYSGALDGLDVAVGPHPGDSDSVMAGLRMGAYIPAPRVVTYDNRVLRRYS